jgi:hypothetical protein
LGYKALKLQLFWEFFAVVIGFCKVSNLSKGAIIACAFVAGSASAKYGTCSKK